MHGGTISVQSDGVEGHGSVFSFTLPVKKTAARTAGKAPAERSKRKSGSRTKARTAAHKK
jgi:hypothetical protein